MSEILFGEGEVAKAKAEKLSVLSKVCKVVQSAMEEFTAASFLSELAFRAPEINKGSALAYLSQLKSAGLVNMEAGENGKGGTYFCEDPEALEGLTSSALKALIAQRKAEHSKG